MPEFRIKFFACQYRRLFKDSMSKQIDCAVAELARQWTKLMAGLPVSIVFTNNVPLDFLNHMQLSSGSHCVFNLKAHLIFAVAYRRKVISSTILERLKELFSEVCRRDRVRLMECSGEEDHVHLLISYPPTICLSTIMFPCLYAKPVRMKKIESSRAWRLKLNPQ